MNVPNKFYSDHSNHHLRTEYEKAQRVGNDKKCAELREVAEWRKRPFTCES